MVFHWNLNDSKTRRVSRTFLSILVDLNNATVLMVSTRPLISKSSSLCTNHLVTVTAKSTIQQILFFSPLFFLVAITWSGRLSEIWWSVCISKSQKSLYVSFWVVLIPFVLMVKFLFLAQFPVIYLAYPVVSSLIRSSSSSSSSYYYYYYYYYYLSFIVTITVCNGSV